MKLGIPTRGVVTDRQCPECGGEVKRRGEKARQATGLVTEERYQCEDRDCLHSWWEDAPSGVYRK